MRKKKNILVICMVILLVMALLVNVVSESTKPFVMTVTFIFFAFYMIVFFSMWRCPHCDRFLGRLDSATHCKYCGKELYK